VLKRLLQRIVPSESVRTIKQFRALVRPGPLPSGEMSDFHHAVIRPEILSRWRPSVLEIGVLNGGHTYLLLDAASRRLGTLVSIDPTPGTAIATVMRFHPLGRLIEDTSLKALNGLVDQKVVFDIAIVDGDHNYYTVLNELRRIAQILSPNGVVYLHDVAWPCGRRDLYYVPERIPAEARHPHSMQGVIKGLNALAESGGLNDSVDNAEYEGGPRNGVLTAVEDFLAEADSRWDFELLDIQYGLGILRHVSRIEAHENVNALSTDLDTLTPKDG
jgi:SAM-dependent methyltransferase